MAIEPNDIDTWRTADALFDQWLDVAEDARAAWLESRQLEPAIRLRLQQLIDAHGRPSTVLDPGTGDLSGLRLGPWTLESELGRGGMAVVYRAWRDDGIARQQAAVKVLTLGALGASGRERFQREAEIQSRLDHPHIVPLVDSGIAADGTCWLAMPLVQGARIDDWAQARGLDTRAVVELLRQVGEAVAHAHRNLVIHRDLKPSNVLVEADGHVRLLDFGIGRFADAGDPQTRTLWRALTPGYAAPEQYTDAPSSTLMDVYGLGALLMRLLTGQPPEVSPLGEATAQPKPSGLVRDPAHPQHRHLQALRTDLDRVLRKALAHDPAQRYGSVEALLADLRRWLGGRPVHAQPPSAGYRLRKFVSRHRWGVAAAAALALAIIGGLGATLWQAELARSEADKARMRAHRAETVRDFLGSTLVGARGSDGGDARVSDVVDAAAADARRKLIDKEPLAAADVLLLTGTVRYNLGDYERSHAELEEALALLGPHQDSSAGELARAHWELGRHAKRRGDIAASQAHHRRAVELNELWDAPPNERQRARISLGETLLHDDRAQAEALFRAVLADIKGSELEGTVRHINVLNGLSIAMSGPDRDQRQRLPIQEERLRLARTLYGPDDGGLAFTLADVTHTFRELGMLQRAEELAREAVQVADRARQQPLVLRGMTRCALGLVMQQRGRQDEALAAFQQAAELLRKSDDGNLAGARCMRGLARAAMAAGKHDAALAALDHADDLLARHGRQGQSEANEGCGLRASTQLRRGDGGAAGRSLDACTPRDAGTVPLAWSQARAEWLLAHGDHAAADTLLTELRGRHPPSHDHREWMRPWMLSALLAQRMQRPTALSSLATALAVHAEQPPMAACLAQPDEANCLAMP